MEINKLLARAYFIPISEFDKAKKIKDFNARYSSDRITMLNGDWRFAYYKSIYELNSNNPLNLQKTSKALI